MTEDIENGIRISATIAKLVIFVVIPLLIAYISHLIKKRRMTKYGSSYIPDKTMYKG